jgi:hypothetical protein
MFSRYHTIPFFLVSRLLVCYSLCCPAATLSAAKMVKTSEADSMVDYQLKSNLSGYKSIITYKKGFLAAGTDGRIDWISESGTVVQTKKPRPVSINTLLLVANNVLAAGDKGVLLVSIDKGDFYQLESGTDQTINALTYFKQKIIAGADQGLLLTGALGESLTPFQLALKGNIVALSANESICFGVTDQGEIIHTTDGLNWIIFDYNEFYFGYYKPSYFTSVLVTDKQIAVAGIKEDGMPVLLFSAQGNVWTDRALAYIDDKGMSVFSKDIPLTIYYDVVEDQFVLACTNGTLHVVPACSHCNKVVHYSTEDLTGIAGNEHTWMLVGANYFVKAIP